MMEEPELLKPPQVLSPCSSRRRRSSASNSPEFEFWMVRNPSFPQPNLLSADELFSDGVLLPLHLLHHPSDDDRPDPPNHPPPPQDKAPDPEASGSDRTDNEPGSISSLLAPGAFTSSKRWRDIFRKGTDRRSPRDGFDDISKEKDKKVKKKEKKSGGGNNNGVSTAELNINIWPFSRSRSAGNGGSRPRMAAAGSTRKVSSAPCSRSNSAGESKSRKWPSSPSRGGVHLGRSSPVWQVRRGRGVDLVARNAADKVVKTESNESRRKSAGVVPGGGVGPKAKVLNLNVPMCIGYRHHLTCRSDENSAVRNEAAAAGAGGGLRGGVAADEVVRGNNLFSLRSLFTKKVH